MLVKNHDNILNSTSSAQQACIFVHVHNCNKSILIKLNFNNKKWFYVLYILFKVHKCKNNSFKETISCKYYVEIIVIYFNK